MQQAELCDRRRILFSLLVLMSSLMLLVVSATARGQMFSCVNNGGAQTKPLRSPSGAVVVLTMRSEDDHAKNTHLCEVSYALQTQQNGATPREIFSSDGAWGRTLVFRVDGFSTDGNHAFLFFSEGEHRTKAITVVDYDLQADTSRMASLKMPRAVSPGCVAALHVAGTNAAGEIVVATSITAACTQTQRWIARADNPNGSSEAEFPQRLPRTMQVTSVSAGMQP